MNYNQIIKYLYTLENKKDWKLGLKSIKNLLKKTKNPEKKLKVIHIAGTNGKGSVCAMISSILKEAGYNVGTYTSPHLVRFNERYLINGKEISNKDIVKYFNKIKPLIDKQTYFEIITALGFLYFYEKKVDFLILETGLGGRLDATNVVKPLVSVITNVSLEHKDFLGNNIEKIAYEKSGIIKKNIPVVTGATGKALKIIKNIALKRNSPLIINHKYKKINNNEFNINNFKNLKLDFLKGDFQLENASIAVTTIEIINKYYNLNLSKKNIKNGLKNTKCAGRFQYIGNFKKISKCQKSQISEHLEKNIIIDCAHNPSSFEVLIKEIKKLKYKKLIVIIGLMKDKEIKKIINILNPITNNFILTKADINRAAEPEIISKYAKKEYISIKNPKKALIYAKKIADKKDLILVTGSFYVVGEVI